jgi:hypothetical protein
VDSLIAFGPPAAGVALVSATVAWLLQRWKPRWHPIVVAIVACMLVALVTIVGAGIVLARALIAIGAAGHADIDNGVAPAMSIVIYGGMVLIMLPFPGLPAALLTAFLGRKPPADRA